MSHIKNQDFNINPKSLIPDKLKIKKLIYKK